MFNFLMNDLPKVFIQLVFKIPFKHHTVRAIHHYLETDYI